MIHIRRGRTLSAMILAAIGGASVVGCGSDKGAQVLRPVDFYTPQTGVGSTASAASPVDKGGALHTQAPGVDIFRAPNEGERNGPAVSSVSNVVSENVKSPETAATQASATRPSGTIPMPRDVATTKLTTRGSGEYLTIGGVVAEVNGTPIYANKVLRALDTALAAEAKKLDEKKFEKTATDLIGKQVQEYISAELEYAAAQRNLDGSDKMIADQLTTQWRQKRIIEAGGSLELARKRAAAEGDDFEDLVSQQHRLYMIRLYYEKKVIPRITVTAEDIRRYYELNKNKEFTDQDQVKFRMIKVDPKRSGGRAQAIEKINDLQKKAAAGADFSLLAESNDDAALMKTKGRVGGEDGWIQKGAFALEKVEDKVFALQPGQVTDLIEENGNFYIAKLEERKIGRVLPFEDEAVQDKIRQTLRTAQFRVLREQVQNNLRKNAVIRVDNSMMDTALEMAMQNYSAWSSAGA